MHAALWLLGGETGHVRPRRQLRSEKARARAARRHLACCVTMEGDTGLMEVIQGRARGLDCLLRSRLPIHRKEASLEHPGALFHM